MRLGYLLKTISGKNYTTLSLIILLSILSLYPFISLKTCASDDSSPEEISIIPTDESKTKFTTTKSSVTTTISVANISELWDKRKTFLKEGDVKKADEAYNELGQIKDKNDLKNLSAYAGAIVHEAFLASKDTNYDLAGNLYTKAIGLANDYVPAYLGLAKLNLQKNNFHPYVSLNYYTQAIQHIFNNIHTMYLFWIYLFLTLLIFPFILFFFFLLINFVKHEGLLRHQIMGHLSGIFTLRVKKVVAILAIILPIIFGIPIWIMYFWGIICWGYVSKKYKFLICLFLIYLLTIPTLLNTTTSLLTSYYNKDTTIFIDIIEGNYHKDLLKKVSDLYRKNKSPQCLLGLAIVNQKYGNFQEALNMYLELIDLKIYMKEAYNNIGVIHFLNKEYNNAQAMFKKGIEIAPESAIAHYNQGRTYANLIDLINSEREINIAQKFNPEFISPYIVKKLAPQVISYELSLDEFWKKAYQSTPESNSMANSLLFFLSRANSPTSFYILISLAILFSIFIHHIWSKKGYAFYCPKCGEPTCSKGHEILSTTDVCRDCEFFLSKKSGIKAKDKIKKIINIRRFTEKQRRIKLLFNLILPGSGQVYTNHIIEGLFYMSTWIFLSLFFILNNFTFYHHPTYNFLFGFKLIGILLAVTYYVSLKRG
ncbi:MAG: hypothetical protein V1872_09295 [bacterium]